MMTIARFALKKSQAIIKGNDNDTMWLIMWEFFILTLETCTVLKEIEKG